MKFVKFSFSLCFLSIFAFNLYAQSQLSSQGHQEAVSIILPTKEGGSPDQSYFSAGKDGFLISWGPDNIGEHYQVTDLEIKMIAVSPSGSEVAVYETDGGAVNRLSVWNWNTLTKKLSRRFVDTITSLSYSENGNYLMIGTASVDGLVFIKTQTNSVVEKIYDTTGIVSYAKTSASEKTAVTYSPVGNLTYYNLTTGKLKKKFNVMQGLEQPLLFNSSMFLAGVKDDKIYVFQATTGKNILTVNAEKAILFSSKEDSNLYYITNDTRGTYVLNMLENIDNQTVSQPRILKTFVNGPRGSSEIICGTKAGNEIMLGGKNGAIYKTDASVQTGSLRLASITENTFEKIYDMAPAGEDFYFLTKKQIYKSSYDTGYVTPLGKNNGHNQFLTYEDNIILWTKEEREAVEIYSTTTKEIKTLFTPKNNLQSIRLFGKTLVEMENASSINLYNFEDGSFRNVYTGAGLQDAVIASNGKLYVAKSYATNPKGALLCVDMETGETVPTNLGGNVSFALEIYNNDIYGIGVQATDNTKSTVVFKYNPLSKTTQGILRLKDEDPDAFSYMHYPLLYTNIGKDTVRAQHLSGGKSFNLKRTASLPLKVCQNSSKVVVLNRDGCISWYEPNGQQVLADWYLTSDGQWFEY